MKVTIYTVNRHDFRSFLGLRDAFLRLFEAREVIFQLAYRDFAVRYRQSIFGYFWAIIPQVLTVAIFTFLAERRVFDMGETDIPYVIYALWSISLWQLFSGCIVNCTNSLIKAGTLVTKVNFPKECVVVAMLAEPILDFIIRLIPVSFVVVWLGYVPSFNAILLPFIVFVVVILALGLGLMFSVLNLFLRDVGGVISMVLTFGVFLSPVFYPPPSVSPFCWVNYLNPFSPLLISTQDLIAGNELSMPLMLAAVTLGAFVCLIVGWVIFLAAIPRVAERA